LIRIYFLAKQFIILSDKSVRIFALKTQSTTLICFAALKTRLFQSWLLLRFVFQQALAAELVLCRTAIVLYEDGKSLPLERYLDKLLKILDVTYKELFEP